MQWTDKYRPQTFKEIIGNGKQKKEIQEWVEAWKEGNPQPSLLLVGPPGVGKTTFAQVIAREFSEYIELNASDKRSYDILMNTIGESTTTKSLFSNNPKLIILDEVDGITGNQDRGGSRAINKIIENTKHPMIMMANDFYSKRLTTIKKKTHVIKMGKVRSTSINVGLRKICKNEGIDADPNALKELSKRANGDMRSAINTLQALCEESKSLTMEDLDNVSQKNDKSNLINAVTRVLKSKNINHIQQDMYVDEDPTLVMEFIAENIPREYKKPEEIKKAYDFISEADLYFGRARQSRNYGYWKYATQFMGLGVALSKDERYKKFTKIQSPQSFAKMGRYRGKRNLRDNIAIKMSEKMHVSMEVAYSMFPYFEIMFQDDRTAYEISSYLELEDNEIKRFRKKKIPKKFIKQMEKERAERRQREREEFALNYQNSQPSNRDKKTEDIEDKESESLKASKKSSNDNKSKTIESNKNSNSSRNNDLKEDNEKPKKEDKEESLETGKKSNEEVMPKTKESSKSNDSGKNNDLKEDKKEDKESETKKKKDNTVQTSLFNF